MTTPTITWFETADTQLGSDNPTVTLTGIAVDTPVVAFVATDFGAPGDLTAPGGTAVSSWTLRQTASVGASGQPQLKAFTGQVTTGGGTVIANGPDASAGGLIVGAGSGVDLLDFPDDSAEQHSTGTHTSAHTAAAVSPTGADDRLIVCKVAADSDGGVTTTTGNTTNTAGMTSRGRVLYDSAATRFMDLEAFDQVLAASGSTGTRAMVYGDTCDYASITVALKGTSGGTTFNQSVAGSTTPTGALAKQPRKTLAGSTTPAGTLVKRPQRTSAGSTTPTGVLLRSVGRLLSGSTAPTGATTKRTTKTHAGSTTPTSTIATTLVRLISLTGSTTPVGVLVRMTAKALAGTTTPSAAVAKRTSKTLSGTTAPVGAVLKLLSRLLGGSTTPSGSVITLIPGATDTPASRTYTVPAETRSHTITAEDRTYVVPAETRTLEVR